MIAETLEKMIQFWMEKHPGQTREQAISNIEHRAEHGGNFSEFADVLLSREKRIQQLISAKLKANPTWSHAAVLNMVQAEHPALFSMDAQIGNDQELKDQITAFITRKMASSGKSYSECLYDAQIENPEIFFKESDTDDGADIENQIENLIQKKMADEPDMEYSDALAVVQIESPLPFACLRSMGP